MISPPVRVIVIALTLGASAVPCVLEARPDLRKARTAGAVLVVPDDVRADLYYYAPGELTLATASDGGPDLHFMHARYTGSAGTGDRGAASFRSVLTLRIAMDGPTATQLTEARRMLATQRQIELRPLPIRRIESAIVYAPAATAEDASEARPLTPGHFEEANNGTTAPREGFWRQRTYTLGVTEIDAQLLAAAFESGGVALSVGYAFVADGIGSDTPIARLSGSQALVAELERQIAEEQPSDDEKASAGRVVRAGAVAVTADLARWPRLMKKVDLNTSAPPGYAALDLYCYDFSQGAPSELYEKQVLIEADGIGGRKVRLSTSFTRSQPDLYARSLRFPVAVRLDRPYRYQVVAIGQDGTQTASPWRERASWTELLDVTVPASSSEGVER